MDVPPTHGDGVVRAVVVEPPIHDPMPFGPFFSTRDTLGAFLAAVFGLAMSDEQLGCFHTARTTHPHVAAREA